MDAVQTEAVLRSPALGSSEDSALALSSAVGSSTDQPLCRTAWAAACTVLSTPALLASTTTVCLRLLRSTLPSPSPSSSGSTWLLMAAWSWGNTGEDWGWSMGLQNKLVRSTVDTPVAHLESEQVQRGNHHALLLLRWRPVRAAVHALANLSQEQVQLLEGQGADVHHKGHTLPNRPLRAGGPGKAL